MNKTTFALTAVASLVAGAAIAQDTTFTNQDRAVDAVEAVEEDIQDSYDRGMSAFGNAGRTLGWTGSISARMTATSGNTDTLDMGLGMRLSYYDGTNGHRIALARNYSEKDDAVSKDEALFGYDYTRDFGSSMYGFGKLSVVYDAADSYKYDAFAGIGIGYRIVNSDRTQWSIQAGPGWRYAEDNAGVKQIDETAVAVSSYFSHELTSSVFLTNDTDILWSETATKVTNNLGLNVAMSDSLALRTSLTSTWDENPLNNFEPTGHTLGASVVYSFN